MIIKSMSRKAPTFLQLAQYIERGAGNGRAFSHNLYHQSANTKIVADQFLENYRYLPKRQNGNALLHEVLVLESQPHLSKSKQIDVLERLARQYCETRARDQLAWGRVHLDTNYPHIHLMISANNVRSKKSARLSKKEFAQCQRDLEAFKQRELPDLRDRVVYRNDHDSQERLRTTSAEGELSRRTGKASDKQQLKTNLSTILNSTSGLKQIEAGLQDIGFELYQRGKQFGVKDIRSGRKYRISTLGLTKVFEAAKAREAGRNIDPNNANSQTSVSYSPQQPPDSDTSLVTDPRSARLKELRETRDRLEREADKELSNFHDDEDRQR